MNDEQLQSILDYDYTEIEKMPGQISSIDETTKMILEELQKEQPLESVEPSAFEMRVLEVLENESTENGELVDENPIDEVLVEESPVEEEPVEEVPVDEVEEVTEEATGEEEVVEELPVEDEVDYLQLLYQEMKTNNELDQQNQTAIIEYLEVIEEQGLETNQVDGMMGLYMMWLIPLAVVISIGAKILNPFLRG